MKSNFKREIKHIRLSVTSKCNYECVYCDNEGFTPKTTELNIEEITKLSKILAEVLKVTRIKLTGGEPLCRRDIVKIVKNIHNLNLYTDISMTTNGFFLLEKAEDLYNAGLNRVNVSLSSLRRDIYKKITKSNSLDKVIKGLNKAKEVGLYPIKLNFVVLKGINDDEINDLIEFCSKTGYILQLIELHDLSDNKANQKDFYNKYHYDFKALITDLESKAIYTIIRGEMQNRKVFFLSNSAVIEVIASSHELCMGCTKLRIGCDGNIFGCLFRSDLGRNIKNDLSNQFSLTQYKTILDSVLNSKEPYY